MGSIMKYKHVIAIILILLTLLITACGRSEEAPLTAPPDAQAGDLIGLEPCIYETGGVEFAAECGTMVVSENRKDPNARLIALPVMRIPARGNDAMEAWPIFWLNGGPGQSNLRFSHPQDLDALLEDHDFVLAGYRGVDG